jgi:hypothetical protein
MAFDRVPRPHIEDVIAEIEAMSRSEPASTWGSYHEDVREKAERFDRIIEIVKSMDGPLETAVDLGGNQGRFSRLLASRIDGLRVVCVDCDEMAVDRGFVQTRQEAGTGRVTFANYDFMGGAAMFRFPLPVERFRADVVLALAVTHHLILGQKFNVDDVMGYIGAYSRKYVLAEFMPLGLWSKGQEVAVPVWYTVDWFRTAFSRRFKIIHEEKLRMNNVLFVGRIAEQ